MGRTLIIVALAAAFGAAASSSPGSPAAAKTATQLAPATQLVTPAVLRGSGSRVMSIRVPAARPLVVTGTHSGSSNFIVRLVGPTNEYLFNEIGRYSGQMAVPESRAGRYRVAVQADGAWVLKFVQPVPYSGAIKIPTTIRSRGSRVLQIRAVRTMQPIVTASHSGQSNFIVQLIGIGNLIGEQEFVFNEIGRYRGQSLLDSMPRGYWLLAVQADGAWSIKFTR